MPKLTGHTFYKLQIGDSFKLVGDDTEYRKRGFKAYTPIGVGTPLKVESTAVPVIPLPRDVRGIFDVEVREVATKYKSARICPTAYYRTEYRIQIDDDDGVWYSVFCRDGDFWIKRNDKRWWRVDRAYIERHHGQRGDVSGGGGGPDRTGGGTNRVIQ